MKCAITVHIEGAVAMRSESQQDLNSKNEQKMKRRQYRALKWTAAFLILASLIVSIVMLCSVKKQMDTNPTHASFEPVKKSSGKCFTAPAEMGDRRVDKEKLTMMNYNAEWLFLNGGSGSMKCPSDKCPWKDKESAMRHFKNVVSQINKFNPDIIHLTEVEGCEMLSMLAENLSAGYNYFLIPGGDTATGQQVGLLTKIDPVIDLKFTKQRKAFPIPSSTCKADSGTTGVTKHYLTKFHVSGRDIVFVGAHLLAFPTRQDRCVRREAQAEVLRDFISENKKEKDEVVIMGDFNDFDSENLGTDSAKPVSQTLSILKNISEGCKLDNVMSKIPVNERYSNWHDVNRNCVDDGAKEHSLIDHILMSPGLSKHIEKVQVLHNYDASCGSEISDHWPVLVTLQF